MYRDHSGAAQPHWGHLCIPTRSCPLSPSGVRRQAGTHPSFPEKVMPKLDIFLGLKDKPHMQTLQRGHHSVLLEEIHQGGVCARVRVCVCKTVILGHANPLQGLIIPPPSSFLSYHSCYPKFFLTVLIFPKVLCVAASGTFSPRMAGGSF